MGRISGSSNQIRVFVKAPVVGKVKTRLCPPLSADKAAALYIALVKDTLDIVGAVPRADLIVAYETAADYPDLSWLGPGHPGRFSAQKGADLGERLRNDFKEAFSGGARKVVVIGSDAPHLTGTIIQKAFALLNKNDVVLGPAEDGGYYLVALKSTQDTIFEGITWSTSQVFNQTVKTAKAHGLTIGTLPKLFDVDMIDDLKKLAAQKIPANQLPHTQEALKDLKSYLH